MAALSLPSLSGALPPALFAIASLTALSIASGSVASLPASVGALTNLRTLSLAGVGMGGTLPSELALCTGLATIDMSGNPGLSGSLPAGLLGLAGLKSLSVAGGGLTGWVSPRRTPRVVCLLFRPLASSVSRNRAPRAPYCSRLGNKSKAA